MGGQNTRSTWGPVRTEPGEVSGPVPRRQLVSVPLASWTPTPPSLPARRSGPQEQKGQRRDRPDPQKGGRVWGRPHCHPSHPWKGACTPRLRRASAPVLRFTDEKMEIGICNHKAIDSPASRPSKVQADLEESLAREGVWAPQGLTHPEVRAPPPAPHSPAGHGAFSSLTEKAILPPTPFMATSHSASSRKPPLMTPWSGTSSRLPGWQRAALCVCSSISPSRAGS